MFKYELGAEARDLVTGFTGVITGRAEYIAGCRNYCLAAAVKSDGSMTTPEWFDEERLTMTGKSVSINATPTGGPTGADRAPTR